jgi:hypothetical protein
VARRGEGVPTARTTGGTSGWRARIAFQARWSATMIARSAVCLVAVCAGMARQRRYSRRRRKPAVGGDRRAGRLGAVALALSAARCRRRCGRPTAAIRVDAGDGGEHGREAVDTRALAVLEGGGGRDGRRRDPIHIRASLVSRHGFVRARVRERTSRSPRCRSQRLPCFATARLWPALVEWLGRSDLAT